MELAFRKILRGDKVIWMILLLLSILSLLIVYSSTGKLAYKEASGNTFHYMIRQLFFLGSGFIIMLVMLNWIPIKMYSVFAGILLYFSIALLIFTQILYRAGVEGVTPRTLFFFQPAEIAKIALIFYAAKILGKKQKTKNDLRVAFNQIIIHTVIVCSIIFLSDFSTSALLFAVIMTMMFVGRIPIKYLILVGFTGMAIVAGIYFYIDLTTPKDAIGRSNTIKGRIDRYLNGDENEIKGTTQAQFAKVAIYEGGILGKGPGHSEIRNFVAAAFSDFIFAIIVEEYGLIGGIIVIFLYLIFFYRGVIIVRRSTRTFPAFLVAGLTLILVYQAMINIGVSTGVLPVTGQPLPWVSLGGTSLLFTSVAFGCILSVSHQKQINREVQEQPVQINAPDEDYEMEK